MPAGVGERRRLVVDNQPSCQGGPVERRCDGDQPCPARLGRRLDGGRPPEPPRGRPGLRDLRREPARVPHGDVFHGAVANRLRRILDRQAPAGVLVGQDIGVSAKRSSYFVPDLFVASESALDSGGAALDPADVRLVVEVISPSNAGRDLVLKRHEYAAVGIPLYWLVEPRKQTLTVLVNGAGGYREQAVFPVGEVYSTEQPFPLTLPLADIF
ncbi:Uma2 family endonuclease [Micromonospora trifolii]|uniref:Uma2 family endonuclease n=1 Tax=Micromonospora trifolii TaxID=2911208 RepID=UPI003D2EA7F5